ncbi:PIN domain-containing protein [Spirosoma fluviale]|uniref:PIN domain-containing protein n=1 Tax=Spirosoma fluviale TaxID=1597977 RepID=UPI000BE32229
MTTTSYSRLSIPNRLIHDSDCWIVHSLDENDTAYIALALELDAELWTRDEALKTGLRLRGFDKFFSE